MKVTSCVRCGSVRMRPIKGALHQRLIAFVLRQDVVACSRCGLHGRQRRAGHAGEGSPNAGVHEGSGPGIDLEGLDRALDRGVDGRAEGRRQ